MGLRESILRRMELDGITPKQLAERAVTQQTLDGFFAGVAIRCRDLERIIYALDLQPTGLRRECQPLRSIVREMLIRRRMTPYQLAKKLKGRVAQRTLYHFLADGQIRTNALEIVLDTLGIEIPSRRLILKRRSHPYATDAQLDFCVDFWVRKLRANSLINTSELLQFRSALRAVLISAGAISVAYNNRMADTLRAGLKGAGLKPRDMPYPCAGVLLNRDGTVEVWENRRTTRFVPSLMPQSSTDGGTEGSDIEG